MKEFKEINIELIKKANEIDEFIQEARETYTRDDFAFILRREMHENNMFRGRALKRMNRVICFLLGTTIMLLVAVIMMMIWNKNIEKGLKLKYEKYCAWEEVYR